MKGTFGGVLSVKVKDWNVGYRMDSKKSPGICSRGFRYSYPVYDPDYPIR